MKLDIYKRPETEGQFSFMAIPSGKVIPEEVPGEEWEVVTYGREIAHVDDFSDLSIDKPFDQLEVKGYAITGAKDLVEGRLQFKL